MFMFSDPGFKRTNVTIVERCSSEDPMLGGGKLIDFVDDVHVIYG